MRRIIGKVMVAFVTMLFLGATLSINTRSARADISVPDSNEMVDLNTSGGQPNSNAGNPTTSQDGRYIAFRSSATDLVSGGTNGDWQIFVRDRATGTTYLASESSSGTEANNDSQNPEISSDGRYVVFSSHATNLVSGVTDNQYNVYMHNMQTGSTTLVSDSSSGTEGNGASQDPEVNADGSEVAFQSTATNLVSSPTVTAHTNIYLKNTSSSAISLLSVSTTDGTPNGDSYTPSIDCDGRFVVFPSYATDLTSSAGSSTPNLYLVDTMNGNTITNIDASANGFMDDPTINCTGEDIGFVSNATNLVSGDTNTHNDDFVYNRIANNFTRVSVDSSNNQSNGDSYGFPTVSGNGRYVVFASQATNLVSAGTNGDEDIFIHDMQTGETALVSLSSSDGQENANSYNTATISEDGQYVTYPSSATNLVSGLGSTNGNIYVSNTGISSSY